MDTQFWIQITITVGSIAALGGGIIARINNLEKKLDKLEQKVDKHNNFDSRLARVEESAKEAHRRIEEVKSYS